MCSSAEREELSKNLEELEAEQEEEEAAILQLESQLEELVVTIRQLEEQVEGKAHHIIRLLFGFSSDSVFVKLSQNDNKY